MHIAHNNLPIANQIISLVLNILPTSMEDEDCAFWPFFSDIKD
jgi:hypothetical protein